MKVKLEAISFSGTLVTMKSLATQRYRWPRRFWKVTPHRQAATRETIFPALAGMTTLHALMPPHPGPLIAVGALHADLGLTMLLGFCLAVPAVILAGSGAVNLAVSGVNFLTGALVRVDGDPRPTGFASSTQLTAALTAADVATARTIVITVANPDGTVSAGVNLIVSATPPVEGPRRRSVRH